MENTNTTQPVSNFQPAPSQSPNYQTPQIHHNKALPVAVLLFTLLVLGGYVVYTKKVAEPKDSKNMDQSNSQQNEQSLSNPKEFATYESTGAKKFKFVYPKAATLKTNDASEDLNVPSDERVYVVYYDLTQVVIVRNGLGGLETLASTPYQIIAGNNTAGVGRIIVDEPNQPYTTVQYFTFYDGGLQLGNMLEDKTFYFQVPKERLAEYQMLMDTLAAKSANMELASDIKWGRAILVNGQTTQLLLAVNPKGEAKELQTIKASDTWSIEIASVSPSGKYLVVYYQNPDQASEKLGFFDLNSQITLPTTGMTDGTQGKWSDDDKYIFTNETGEMQTIEPR